MAGKPLLCWLRIHRWVDHRNPESGERYLTCARCGKDSDKITLNQPGLPGM
jgi:hypothetical protein